MGKSNLDLNAQLLKEAHRIKDKVDNLQIRIDSKIHEYKQKQEELNVNRTQIFDKIDSFFDLVVKRVNERKEKLKTDYKTIEAKEKRRLKSKQMKMEKDITELKNFSIDFQEFFTDFDNEMDYLANKASLDG
jgi:hypothetical protein